jgi:hypothetical protein
LSEDVFGESLEQSKADMKRIYSQYILDNSFIDHILETENEDMWKPTLKELANANIVTHVQVGTDDWILVKIESYLSSIEYE